MASVVIRVRPSLEPNEEGFLLLIFDEYPVSSVASEQARFRERQ